MVARNIYRCSYDMTYESQSILRMVEPYQGCTQDSMSPLAFGSVEPQGSFVALSSGNGSDLLLLANGGWKSL